MMGCKRAPKVPGETDIVVSAVTLQSADGSELQVDYADLMDRLGMRAKSLILPGRTYSEFREAEDRRRIRAFWHTYGYFEVDVAEPKTEFDASANSVAITWLIKENVRYKIASVELLHAPEAYRDTLAEMIPFAAGAVNVDLEAFRKVRVDMAEHLRDDGFGHAMVYSRVFVDTTEKQLHWYYYVDAGPKTVIGNVIVQGNQRIPAEVVKERAGMIAGEPYTQLKRLKREWDLLDTGAFASAFIRPNTDTVFLVPGDAPDKGGVLRDEQVDAHGNLVPRKLDEKVDLTLHVVESPSQQLRSRAGVQFDPTRIDTTVDATLWLRNIFGPLHHLTIEGRLGHGFLWRSTTEQPVGLYGDALLRYVRPGAIGRTGDFRLSGRFRDELYPGFHLQEVTTGPGIRTTFAAGWTFDFDLYFRYGHERGFGPFEPTVRDAFALSSRSDSYGGELQSSLIWDTRDNPVEAKRGHLLALHTSLSPGGPLGTHRYWTLHPEARGFVPLTPSLSLALHASGGWALLHDEAGVPLGPRQFGGGAFGFRGQGRQHLAPRAPSCLFTPEGRRLVCQNVFAGGLSLVETSAELRLLPKLKPYGAVVFADLAGAGANANPFDEGVSVAAGLGLRLRFWYLPAAIDFSYRIVDRNEPQVPADEPFLVFFRLGEAF